MTITEAFNELIDNWKNQNPEFKSKYKTYKSRYLNNSGIQDKNVSKDKIIEMLEAAGYRIEALKINRFINMDFEKIEWKPNIINEFTHFKLLDAVNEKEHFAKVVKFPELLPVAYFRFPNIDVIHLFLFNSDGAIFKHGYVRENYIYDFSDGQKLKSIKELIELKLFQRIGEC